MKKIAIIGGGIAGLTFANCMAGLNYELHIFEQKSKFEEIGAAISVFPNALCVLDYLGLLNQIIAASGAFKTVYIKTQTGEILSKSEPKSDYPVICMHRAALHAILMDGIKAHLHVNMNLKDFEILKNGQIKLSFQNDEELVFDAVIGADGINSVARNFVLQDGKPVFRGYNIWRGVVKTDFDIGYGSETFGIGKRVGIVPIKDGVYGWWATCNEAYLQNDEPEGTKAKLKRLFGDWHHPIPDLIEQTQHIIKNSLVDRKPTKGWSKNMVVLIGDAAHPTTPNLGQGGCIAIEGAFLLASCIEKYGLNMSAFERYEALHYTRAAKVNNESLKLGKMGQVTNPFLAQLRNFAFKMMPDKLSMRIIA